MLSQKTIESMAGMLKLNVEELTKGISSEDEVNIDMPSLKVFTTEDYDTLIDNHGKTRYDAGKLAGNEISLKDLSKEVGIETSKTSKDFVSAYKTMILEEAKVEPNNKIQELETSNTNLRGIIEEKDNEMNTLSNRMKTNEQKSKVQSWIPTLPENIGINKEEATTLFFTGLEVKDDGVYKNGILQKDHLENNITLEQSVKDFVSSKGWDKKTPIGRGGGGQGGGTSSPKTYDDFIDTIKEKGWTEGSVEANALLQDIAKENPEVLD